MQVTSQTLSRQGASKMVILGTGGTIAGRAASANDNIGYTAAQVTVAQLIADVPGLQGLALHTEQVAQLDSKDMAFAVWQALLGRVVHFLVQDDVAAIVITHGTDTLEETAFFLHAALVGTGLLTKPVVLTCAMRPATSQSPDGPQNLLDAVAVAHDSARSGVTVVCAGVVHGPVDVQKMHSYRLDAFSSGEAGPLGWVEEGRVRWAREIPINPSIQPLVQSGWSSDAIKNTVNAVNWPRVEIVLNHTGADGRWVDLLLKERVLSGTPGEAGYGDVLQGLVVAGTGNGTVHADLLAVLGRAEAAGVRVWRTSRCALGQIVGAQAVPAMPAPETATGDKLPFVSSLSPVKARIAMTLVLLGGAGC